MAKEPTPPPGKKIKPPINRWAKTEEMPSITKPPPPPAPPPKSGSAPLVAGIDAKLDEIMEWLKALGAYVVDMGPCPSDLERLVAQHRGQCSQCLGEGWIATPGDPADPHRARIGERCEACNGRGKAKEQGE